MSRINLTDDADTIAGKIRKARTDAEPLPETVAGLAGRPEAANLVNIYAALSNTDAAAVLGEFDGKNFSEFKPRLAELAVSELAPITSRISELTADPAEIDRLLGMGAEKAASVAGPILARTYEIVGMVR